MNNNIDTITNLLHVKYQTWFSVNVEGFRYILIPDNREELAGILDCEVDSKDFLYALDKIEEAVNLLF